MLFAKALIAVFVVCTGVSFDVVAGNGASNPSHDALISFYDRPSNLRTIRETRYESGRLEVEICSDECDVFIVSSRTQSVAYWDMILLFKAYLSPREEDRALRAEYPSLISSVLAKYSPKGCGAIKEEKQRVNCVVGSISKKIKLEYAFVRYDEGSRCLAYKRIDDLSNVIRGECIKRN